MRTDIASLMGDLGIDVDPSLMRQSLMHRSYSYENGGVPTNERLEFLGDAVLGIVVTQALYERYPDCSEGQLAKLRAAVVNAQALADVARTLDLGEYVYLGRGEESTGGRDKSSILADTMEAVVAAVFLTSGLDSTADVIHRLFDPLITRAADLGAALDWKTSLQEIASVAGLGLPEYRVSDIGPDHAKEFSAQAIVGGDVLGEGEGRSKKLAEQQAAATAYERIRATLPEPD
ncbi:MAG: ribonuclease III [Actinomycetota bacterium]|nr:ribonuclease III [Actinomycetota bacterium]